MFRCGLGFLAGGRLMMLEHRGRRTGRRRLAVLEVVGRRPGVVDVVSGYGMTAQWCRNVQADPRVRVWVGTRRAVDATAHVLREPQAVEVLDSYRRRHARAARALGRMLAINDLIDGGPLAADVARRLPVVRFTTDPDGTQ